MFWIKLFYPGLTLTSNAHAAEVAECPTQGDTGCVAKAMYEGKVVLPPAVLKVFGGAADARVVVLFEFCRYKTV
jgi:hypothetical protein